MVQPLAESRDDQRLFPGRRLGGLPVARLFGLGRLALLLRGRRLFLQVTAAGLGNFEVTKTELVASIASATGESQATVSRVLDSLFGTVSDAVAKGSKVSIPGWIAFEQVDTAARTGRNPQTGAEIKIPASKGPAFKAGSAFKERVAKG